jgi:hypothetical protein
MTIARLLFKILDMSALAIPKDKHRREDISRVFGKGVFCGETAAAWLVRCSHTIGLPAKDTDIRQAEEEIGLTIPEEYREFLRQCNGARLFQIPQVWQQDVFPQATHVHYDVFGTTQLVRTNRLVWERFRSVLGHDPDFRDVTRMNYVVMCDATDGNYQAVLLEGQDQGKVFFLDHEYFYRPYSELDSDLYYTIASSVTEWFEVIIRTGGWGGRGKMTGGL